LQGHFFSLFSLSPSLAKEIDHYRNELIANEQQLQAIQQDDSKDTADVKRYQGLVDESLQMIPLAVERHNEAVQQLETLLLEECTGGVSEYRTVAQDLVQAAREKQDAIVISTNVDDDDLAEGEVFWIWVF